MAMIVAATLLALAVPTAVQAAEYQLGAMDKLSIRVAEWQTAEAAVRDWGSINGDYAVSSGGTISLPFIGEMVVKGKSTADVAAKIGEELQQKFGLLDQPYASVEIAEYRPFFVAGDAQTPGRYPYMPDLTVLKAVSLAGGVRRADNLGARYLRDFINARGDYQVLASKRLGLLAARARLISEAAGNDQIDFPKELDNTAEGTKLMKDETAFKETRKKKLDVQLNALADLKSLLQKEVTSLSQKMDTQQRQADLSKKELTSVGSLANKGLAVNQRVLTLEQRTADLEGKILDLETTQLQAKQAISKADQDAASLRNDFEAEVAQTRQQVESDLVAANLKIGMYKDLMAEAAQNDPGLARYSAQGSPLAVNYSIARETGGKIVEIQADENTAVLPGDIVKVRLVLPTANSN
ncbi:MAG: polysaccharide biosynthesis/export family protein [Hyphomicrobiales bacterium]|nr:polysaccharide biosynthesis/export family protein [Hyphomicrobiales bacterium]